MLNSILSSEGFYYSSTYDLSHTLQRLSDTDPKFKASSIYERVSTLFFNKTPNQVVIVSFKEIFEFFLPIIYANTIIGLL